MNPVLVFFGFVSVPEMAEELDGLGILRLVHHLGGCAVLGDDAVTEQYDAVGRFVGEAHFVRGHEDCGALGL